MKRIGALLLGMIWVLYLCYSFLTDSDFKVSFSNGLLSFSDEFGGKGHFASCVRVNNSPWHPVISLSSRTDMSLSSRTDSSWIRMELLPDTTEGVYSFPQSASPGIDYYVAGELYDGDTSVFFSSSDSSTDITLGSGIIMGEVRFDAFPDAPYEPVRGSFKIVTYDASGSEIFVRGQFDFKASGNVSHDCLKR